VRVRIRIGVGDTAPAVRQELPCCTPKAAGPADGPAAGPADTQPGKQEHKPQAGRETATTPVPVVPPPGAGVRHALPQETFVQRQEEAGADVCQRGFRIG